LGLIEVTLILNERIKTYRHSIKIVIFLESVDIIGSIIHIITWVSPFTLTLVNLLILRNSVKFVMDQHSLIRLILIFSILVQFFFAVTISHILTCYIGLMIWF
jgi:hypothetical protein